MKIQSVSGEHSEQLTCAENTVNEDGSSRKRLDDDGAFKASRVEIALEMKPPTAPGKSPVEFDTRKPVTEVLDESEVRIVAAGNLEVVGTLKIGVFAECLLNVMFGHTTMDLVALDYRSVPSPIARSRRFGAVDTAELRELVKSAWDGPTRDKTSQYIMAVNPPREGVDSHGVMDRFARKAGILGRFDKIEKPYWNYGRTRLPSAMKRQGK